jgi:ATP-dependent Clp protease adaptor protein ClpS|tara:strand:- start:1589 stop:1894 length:306 start_codon:yes stop_codon:yes gene_type:complete
MSQEEIATAEKKKTALKSPNKYHVVFLNDNVTPMEYVIQVLVAFFGKGSDEANIITLEIHEKGRSIAGSYSYEVAEQKCIETVTDARKHSYPLDVVMEETT